MAMLQRSALQAAATGRTPAAPVRSASGRRCCVTVAAAPQDASVVSRRDALMLSTAALSLLASASPALAFPFGDDTEEVKAKYTSESSAILKQVNTVLALDRNDPTKEESVKAMRKDINSWVAKYRREPRVSGRPSYGNMYSALNAVAGHYNNFGPTAPIPKKRLDRLVKELNDAELFLTKGR